MFAAAAVVLTVMLATHCHSLSASEFEKSVGTCGVSPNEHFDSRADARANEFPWNVQLFYTLGKLMGYDSPRMLLNVDNYDFVLNANRWEYTKKSHNVRRDDNQPESRSHNGILFAIASVEEIIGQIVSGIQCGIRLKLLQNNLTIKIEFAERLFASVTGIGARRGSQIFQFQKYSYTINSITMFAPNETILVS